jgi:acetyl esterase/lipase
MSRDAIAAQRKANFDLYAPVGIASQKALGVTIEESRVAGVPVEWMSPRAVLGEQIILYFFGGGHVLGSPSEDLAITARLAHFAGRRVCAVRYRLAPENPYPAALEDALAVYSDLAARGARSIAVAGESAGGNLSLALVHAAARRGLDLPAALALLSPWCDLTHSGDTIRTLDGIDPTLGLEQLLGPMARAYAGGRPLDDPGVSPLLADVPKGFPPTLITSGTRDMLLSDSARLAAKLRRAGVDAEIRVYEGMWHVFEFYPDVPEGEESLRGISAFLEARWR